MNALLPDCRINYALIKLLPFCHEHVLKQKADILETNSASSLDCWLLELITFNIYRRLMLISVAIYHSCIWSSLFCTFGC